MRREEGERSAAARGNGPDGEEGSLPGRMGSRQDWGLNAHAARLRGAGQDGFDCRRPAEDAPSFESKVDDEIETVGEETWLQHTLLLPDRGRTPPTPSQACPRRERIGEGGWALPGRRTKHAGRAGSSN